MSSGAVIPILPPPAGGDLGGPDLGQAYRDLYLQGAFRDTEGNAATLKQLIAGGGGQTIISQLQVNWYASVPLSSFRAVVALKDGTIQYADPTIGLATVGIGINSAMVGEMVKVILQGVITHSGWSFVPGLVFVGVNGELVQSPPSLAPEETGDKYRIILGTAYNETTLILNPDHSIVRL